MELQPNRPELRSKTYSDPVVDLEGAVQSSWNSNAERYRKLGDPITMVDASSHTIAYGKFNN